MPISFVSLQHVNLPINITIIVTIWHSVYSFMTLFSSNLISRTTILLTRYLQLDKYNIEAFIVWQARVFHLWKSVSLMFSDNIMPNLNSHSKEESVIFLKSNAAKAASDV